LGICGYDLVEFRRARDTRVHFSRRYLRSSYQCFQRRVREATDDCQLEDIQSYDGDDFLSTTSDWDDEELGEVGEEHKSLENEEQLPTRPISPSG